MAAPENPKSTEPRKPVQEAAGARQGDPKPQDVQSTAPEAQEAPAAPQEPEAPKRWDQTVPGGRYEVGGRMVDADGKPLSEKK